MPKLFSVALAAASLAALLAFTGCGEKSEQAATRPVLESVDLALDRYPNAGHVGIYQALDAGYFDQAGLKVAPRIPSDPAAPIEQVAAGRVDLAISYEPEVFLAREQGLDVVAVAAIVQRPLSSPISLQKKGVDLELRGKKLRVAPADKRGIPTYDELVLVAQGKRLARDPDAIRRFIAALARGTRDAIRHPKRATKALLAANDDLKARATRAGVLKTLPALAPDRKGDPFGFMDTRQWEEYGGWMVDEGVLKVRQSIKEVLTNRLLPSRKLKG